MNMSIGDIRRNQSANFLKSLKKAGEEINHRSNQLRQKDENTPGIILDVPSTSTLIGEKPPPNLKLLLTDKQERNKKSI